MALEKEITTPTGVIGNYHRILKVEVSPVDGCVTIVCAIYPSAETRENYDTPTWHEYVRIPISTLEEDPLTDFYTLLKTCPESYLVGAVDSNE